MEMLSLRIKVHSCSPHSTSICHLSAWPGEAAAWRCSAASVPRPRHSSHQFPVEPNRPSFTATSDRDDKGWKTPHRSHSSYWQWNIQMCCQQPHWLQRGIRQSHSERWATVNIICASWLDYLVLKLFFLFLFQHKPIWWQSGWMIIKHLLKVSAGLNRWHWELKFIARQEILNT